MPSMNYEVGLLVEGFDTPPFFMMTYNKPYYERLFLENGLAKTQDVYAFWGHLNMYAKLDPKLQYIVDTARERFNIKVRPLDKNNFQRDTRILCRNLQPLAYQDLGLCSLLQGRGRSIWPSGSSDCSCPS